MENIVISWVVYFGLNKNQKYEPKKSNIKIIVAKSSKSTTFKPKNDHKMQNELFLYDEAAKMIKSLRLGSEIARKIDMPVTIFNRKMRNEKHRFSGKERISVVQALGQIAAELSVFAPKMEDL